jgi:hypothetical protein
MFFDDEEYHNNDPMMNQGYGGGYGGGYGRGGMGYQQPP